MNKKKLLKRSLTTILAGSLFFGTFYNQDNDAPPIYTQLKQETHNYGITTGIVSYIPNKTKIEGIVPSIFNANDGTINGLDVKLLSYSKGTTNGVDIGAISYTEKNNGVKIGWENITKYLNGVQIGFWIVAMETKGLQIGIINENQSSNFKGMQIGLINYYAGNYNMIFRYETKWKERINVSKELNFIDKLHGAVVPTFLLIALFGYLMRRESINEQKKEKRSY